jgi:hypothetical protein
MVRLELQLDERRSDRVIVSLRISPATEAPTTVDGAAVQLLSPEGEELCPRMLLPIAGTLAGPLATRVELRADRKLPQGCEILVTAWQGPELSTERCPADPFTNLRDHVRGSRIGLPDPDDVELDVPSEAERAAIRDRLPWITQLLRTPDATAVIEVHEPVTPDDLQEDFGLGAEEAEWLRDLLEEPDA